MREIREIVSILILLDYLFLFYKNWETSYLKREGLNPYFIGLPILIRLNRPRYIPDRGRVSILILLDYLFLWEEIRRDIYAMSGVSILILLDYLFL